LGGGKKKHFVTVESKGNCLWGDSDACLRLLGGVLKGRVKSNSVSRAGMVPGSGRCGGEKKN